MLQETEVKTERDQTVNFHYSIRLEISRTNAYFSIQLFKKVNKKHIGTDRQEKVAFF